MLLLIPVASLILALTAQHLSRQILQIARYLKEIASIADYVMQPMLARVFTSSQRQYGIAWTWESWKRNDYKQRDPMTRFFYWLLEKARWLSLLLPGIVSLGIFAIMHGEFSSVPWYLFWISLAVLLLSTLVIARYTEVSGVKDDKQDFRPFSSRAGAADIAGQASVITGLAATGALGPGLATSDAADIVYALQSPEVQRILTAERGWPAERYEHWASLSLPSLLRAGERPPLGLGSKPTGPEDLGKATTAATGGANS